MTDDFSRGGNPYQQPAAAGPPAGTSGKAIASLVLGLSSCVFCFITGIPAIILGVLGLGDVKRSGGRAGGSGLATAGIVLGSLGTMFTLVLLIVPALLLPAVQAARQAARRAQSSNNMKQVALALLNYEQTQQSFPAAHSTDDAGQAKLSWRVAILPFVEQQGLAGQFHADEPWNSPDNQALVNVCPGVFIAPGDEANPGHETNILGVVGPDTVLATGAPVTMADIRDGTSNTIVAVELAGTGIAWSEPRDITVDELVAAIGRQPGDPGPRCVYPGGAHCVFADGSVHFISSSIDPAVLRALCTRSGGERASGPPD